MTTIHTQRPTLLYVACFYPDESAFTGLLLSRHSQPRSQQPGAADSNGLSQQSTSSAEARCRDARRVLVADVSGTPKRPSWRSADAVGLAGACATGGAVRLECGCCGPGCLVLRYTPFSDGRVVRCPCRTVPDERKPVSNGRSRRAEDVRILRARHVKSDTDGVDSNEFYSVHGLFASRWITPQINKRGWRS